MPEARQQGERNRVKSATTFGGLQLSGEKMATRLSVANALHIDAICATSLVVRVLAVHWSVCTHPGVVRNTPMDEKEEQNCYALLASSIEAVR